MGQNYKITISHALSIILFVKTQVYHFCHKYGKQDTFYCPYGTIFNEYLGTCDYKNNVKCSGSGEGYKGPLPTPHHEPDSYHAPPHDDGGYHAPPKPYKHHVSYHEHEQYHHSSKPTLHDSYGPPPHEEYHGSPHDGYGIPAHEGYGAPHHDTYGAPHHDTYGGPPHHSSYHHDTSPYHIDAFKDDGYGSEDFGGNRPSSFIDGFGAGFGEANGFGPGFAGQKLRRSDNVSPEVPLEKSKKPYKRVNRREKPRNMDFSLDTKKIQTNSEENKFGSYRRQNRREKLGNTDFSSGTDDFQTKPEEEELGLYRRGNRRETPRNTDFSSDADNFEINPEENGFGFDGLKAFGFGLRV